jgi:hypothetical protein
VGKPKVRPGVPGAVNGAPNGPGAAPGEDPSRVLWYVDPLWLKSLRAWVAFCAYWSASVPASSAWPDAVLACVLMRVASSGLVVAVTELLSLSASASLAAWRCLAVSQAWRRRLISDWQWSSAVA